MADEVEHGRDLDRVSAFSDGVFAIAITVLVLSIDIPNVRESRLADVLDSLVRPVLTYFLSFAVIGFYWIAHHRMWHFIRRVDSGFLMLNMLLLSFVALMPFPTDLLGTYGDTSEATAVYAAAAACTGLASTILWWYVSRGNRLIRADVPADYSRRVLLRAASVPVIFGITIPLAFLSADIAKLCWVLLWPTRVVLTRRYGDIYEM